jgi:phospholipid transport system substrate-binding protein
MTQGEIINVPVLKYIVCAVTTVLFMVIAPVNASAADAAPGAPAEQTGSVQQNSPVVQFVQELGNKALTSLTARNLADEERSKRVRELLLQYFDIQKIGRFVLGPYWAQATENQRQEYLSLFEDMIVRTYTHRFADYSGQSFSVKGVVTEEQGSQDSIVSSVIIQPNGPPVHVDWRVRNESGTFKIVDVLIENVSMSITQRADFASIIQNGGGKIDALLGALKNHGK